MFSRYTLASIVLLSIGACGSLSNFVRPADEQVHLGKTTAADIVRLLQRQANATGQKTINGTLVDVLEYSHLSPDNTLSDTPDEEGFVAVKGQYYYLVDNTVVGSEYYSTFAEDSTRFDTSQIAAIVKGKSTRADVIELFGQPSIRLISPLVTNGSAGAIGYHYRTMNLANPGDLKTTSARLIIEYSIDGRVTDIQYESYSDKTQ